MPQYEHSPASRSPASRSIRPDPEDVTILDGHRRVGATQRDIYLNHLGDLHARGYLSTEEFDARQAAAQKAETEYDLNRLIADTPGLAEPSASAARRLLRSPSLLLSWLGTPGQHKGPLVAAGFTTWVLASITWAIVPSAIFGLFNQPQSGTEVALIIFFIISAAVSVICCIVTAVTYYEGS